MDDDKKRYRLQWDDKEHAPVRSLQGYLMQISPDCGYFCVTDGAKQPKIEESE